MIAATASTPTIHAAAIVTETHVFRGEARVTAIFAANLKPGDGAVASRHSTVPNPASGV